MLGKIEIVKLFGRDLTRELTIRQISKLIKKSYAYTNKTVWELIKEGVLTSREIGRSVVCSLDIGNEVTRELLAFGSFLDRPKLDISKFTDSYFAFSFGNKVHTVGPKGMSLDEFASFVKKKGIGKVVYGFEKYWEKIGDIYE